MDEMVFQLSTRETLTANIQLPSTASSSKVGIGKVGYMKVSEDQEVNE